MSTYLLLGAIEEGLIYAFVALGLFISYEILGIADMTTDGTFVLGSAVSTMVVMAGHPLLALPAAIICGMLAGFVTAMLQRKLGVPSILAGIVTMTGLYTINLLVQGGVANRFFPKEETVFSIGKRIFGETAGVFAVLILLLTIMVIFLGWFMSTQTGLSIRATGDNIEMVQASSINPDFTITLGLCMSNGLVALAGALIAQKNTQGDLSIGQGVVVIGLASLVIGKVIVRKGRIIFKMIGAVLGGLIYRVIYTVALKYTPSPDYLKIMSAVIIAAVISYPTVSAKIKEQKRRKGEGQNA